MPSCVMDSPVGRLLLMEKDGAVTALRRTEDALLPPETPLLAEAVRQLRAYFDGTLTVFDLPVSVSGTPFQEACWAALRDIPYGTTVTYAEQARRIGRPRAARAVGDANHRNPVWILLPCHRVVGANGALTGYGGGLEMKAWLLAHEKKHQTQTAGCPSAGTT